MSHPSDHQIVSLRAEQLDASRIRCTVTVKDEAIPADLIIEVWDPFGNRVASITILESPDLVNKYVLHIPAQHQKGDINVIAYLKNDTLGLVHQVTENITLE